MTTEAVVPTVIQGSVITLREARNVLVPAGGEKRIHFEGTFFRVMESTGPFRVRFDGGGEATFDKSLSYEVGRDQFKYFDVINTDLINDLTVSVIATDGRVEDNRVSISSTNSLPIDIQTNAPAPLIGASGVIALPAAGSVQIAPANQNRTEINIKNVSPVLVLLNGGAWVLFQGEEIKLPFRDAITAETVSANVGRVAVLEG